MKSRINSVVLVGIIIAMVLGETAKIDVPHILRLKGLLFPLALIWFSEPLGQYTGSVGRGGYIDSPTPGILVAAVGWIWIIALLVITARACLAHPA